MLFLDKSFFYGDIHIPNLDEKAVSLTQVDLLLSKWEKEAFTLLLGSDLYNEFKSQLTTDTEGKIIVKEDADVKWKELLNGGNVSDCDCCKKKWGGIVSYDDVLYNGEIHKRKSSLLAYYAYFAWSLSKNTNTTGTGEQKPKTKNSEWLNNVRKRTMAWNRFVSEGRRLQQFAKCKFDNFCGANLNYKTTCGI